MPKYNMQKNSNTHFVIVQAKKIGTAQGKSLNANIYAFKMETTNGSVKHMCKSELFALQHTRQTWPVVPTTKKYQNSRAIEFPNFFKTKKLTNQIRAVLPLGYV